MHFFDYLYYTIYKYGVRVGESDPHSYSVMLIALSEMLWIDGVILFLVAFGIGKITFSISIGITVPTIALLFNFFLFKKDSQEIFLERCKEEPKMKRKVKGLLVFLFIILSFVFAVSAALKD